MPISNKRTKLAKLGMAVGSLMAVSTCALAMMGSQNFDSASGNIMMEDQMYEVARGL